MQSAPSNPYIYFVHKLHGSISNQKTAEFYVNVFRQTSGDAIIQETSEKDLFGPTSVDQTVYLRLSANALVYDNDSSGNPLYATYTMSLLVNGGSAFGANPQFLGDGTSDFAATASITFTSGMRTGTACSRATSSRSSVTRAPT